MLLAIDPGNEESAFVVIDENLKPIWFEKVINENMMNYISDGCFNNCNIASIEMIASYGMAVGKEVFETCVFIGRLYDRLERRSHIEKVNFVYRKEVKLHICGTTKAKDSNIRQALIDRFGEVGTKKAPGWFYGFKKDIWSAYAVAVTWTEIRKAAG